MEKKDSESVKELFKEEQDKLLDEIKEKAKKRKKLMNPYDDDKNELLN